jgi:signal transduction histidine kinase
VKIDGNYFLTSYILAPHNLASNVGNLVNQQKNFSIFIIIIITVAAIVVAFFVLSWNRRLKAIIISKTEELRTSNVSLIDTNKQLAKANDELKNHDIIQKEFINIAAHELRTPIQPILGLSGLLLRDKQTEKKRQELLEIVFRNAKRLERLTDDILDITRIESKSLKLKMELFNLSEMLRDVISDFQNQIDKGQIARANRKLEFIGLDEDIFVKADKDRIHQVISNLLSNAIKFTNEGEVTISVTKFDDRTVVSVKDAGSGIDPKILPKLFTKFATKSGSGTGLGLFISKNIVEAHGGNMWGKNNANEKGATFSFSLPSESD